MAGVPIDRAGGVKVARSLGASGRPITPEIAADPALRAAYYDGAGTPDPDTPDPTPAPAPAKPATKPARPAAAKPAATRGRPGRRGRRGPAGRAADATFNARNTKGLATHPARTATGSAGGLALAIFVYPIVLAVLKHGPKGVPEWLGAKFLNKGTGTLASVRNKKGSGK